MILFVTTTVMSKKPPPKYSPPVCGKPPCLSRRIHVKIYIDDALWKEMKKTWDSKTHEIVMFQVKKTFRKINKLLKDLDDGGFRLVFKKKDVIKLSDSNIELSETYTDRLDENRTKYLNNVDIFSHTFAFQEAVEKLTDRSKRDLRILMRIQKDHNPGLLATSEENCICNLNGFACVASFSIQFTAEWWTHRVNFAHAIAHALGTSEHDDDIYSKNPNDKLIMWKHPGIDANIWSPNAKMGINKHAHSCLKVGLPKKKTKLRG